jgi:hypothetical protein
VAGMNQNGYTIKDMIEIIKDDVAEIKEDVKDGFKEQNGRIRKLENWRWYLVGIVMGGMTIGTLLLKYA